MNEQFGKAIIYRHLNLTHVLPHHTCTHVKESTPPNRHFLYIDADMWLSWSCFVENQ